MAQNVTIAGASYSAVPSISVPKTGGGTASFVDTSDADATAEEIVKDKVAYVNGTRVVGTLEGGGTVQTRKIYDSLYMGWGHVSWLDATGTPRTDTMYDDELIEYIEPQIGSLVSRLGAGTPMSNQNLQVVDSEQIVPIRPPVTYYYDVWIVT